MEKKSVEQIANEDYFEAESFFENYIKSGKFSTVQKVAEHLRFAARHRVLGKSKVSDTGIMLLDAYESMSRDEFSVFVQSI